MSLSAARSYTYHGHPNEERPVPFIPAQQIYELRRTHGNFHCCPNALVDDKSLDVYMRGVLQFLMRHDRQGSGVRASAEDIAHEIPVSRRRVQQALADLVSGGHIVPRTSPGGRSVYFLSLRVLVGDGADTLLIHPSGTLDGALDRLREDAADRASGTSEEAASTYPEPTLLHPPAHDVHTPSAPRALPGPERSAPRALPTSGLKKPTEYVPKDISPGLTPCRSIGQEPPGAHVPLPGCEPPPAPPSKLRSRTKPQRGDGGGPGDETIPPGYERETALLTTLFMPLTPENAEAMRLLIAEFSPKVTMSMEYHALQARSHIKTSSRKYALRRTTFFKNWLTNEARYEAKYGARDASDPPRRGTERPPRQTTEPPLSPREQEYVDDQRRRREMTPAAYEADWALRNPELAARKAAFEADKAAKAAKATQQEGR